MSDIKSKGSSECTSRFIALRNLTLRASMLSFNFMLIIMAIYQLKPASRSSFIEAMGADMLPYVWIGTAAAMLVFIPLYNHMVERFSRLHVVLGSCLAAIALLVFFHARIQTAGAYSAFGFYVFVDVVSVVLVEQFWCLTDSVYTTDEGKSWYGLIGTGGLFGGVAGGAVGAFLLRHTPLTTPDLLLVAAGTIGLIFLLTFFMQSCGMYCEADNPSSHARVGGGLKAILGSRYLVLIAVLLLLGQVASQFVEFSFLKSVEATHPEREARTAYLSLFFSVLNTVSIGVNLVATPLVHRKMGAIAGLLVQPLMMTASSLGFVFSPTLLWGSVAKICDRGLSYSINRASRELLYVPVNPVVIYQAKAWIDMFGYRMFKVFGSFVILLSTQWLPVALPLRAMGGLTIATCAAWIAIAAMLAADYRLFTEEAEGKEPAAPPEASA